MSARSETTECFEFDIVNNWIFELIYLLNGDKTLLYELNSRLDTHEKRSNEFTEYQHREHMAPRRSKNDRVHPLDTVSILEFKGDHKRDIEEVFLHSGGYADKYARSFNALAITIANHIYFRSNAYNPHSEEGRKLLTHELTHVAQYKEGAITKNTNKDDLEIEAEKAEKIAEYEDDPIVTIEVDGEYFRFRESKMDEYAKLVANDTREWMLEQKAMKSDEEYLKLLCSYEKWIKEHL